jgi:hypothetical protein
MQYQDDLPLTRENIAYLKRKMVADRAIARQKQIDTALQQMNGEWKGKHQGVIAKSESRIKRISHIQRKARVRANSIAADPRNKTVSSVTKNKMTFAK